MKACRLPEPARARCARCDGALSASNVAHRASAYCATCAPCSRCGSAAQPAPAAAAPAPEPAPAAQPAELEALRAEVRRLEDVAQTLCRDPRARAEGAALELATAAQAAAADAERRAEGALALQREQYATHKAELDSAWRRIRELEDAATRAQHVAPAGESPRSAAARLRRELEAAQRKCANLERNAAGAVREAAELREALRDAKAPTDVETRKAFEALREELAEARDERDAARGEARDAEKAAEDADRELEKAREERDNAAEELKGYHDNASEAEAAGRDLAGALAEVLQALSECTGLRPLALADGARCRGMTTLRLEGPAREVARELELGTARGAAAHVASGYGFSE